MSYLLTAAGNGDAETVGVFPLSRKRNLLTRAELCISPVRRLFICGTAAAVYMYGDGHVDKLLLRVGTISKMAICRGGMESRRRAEFCKPRSAGRHFI